MHIRFGKGLARPFFEIGPSVNMLLNLEGKIESNQKDWLPEVLFSSIAVGISTGTGIAWRPGDGALELSLSGRFNLITLNIFDNAATLQLILGLGF